MTRVIKKLSEPRTLLFLGVSYTLFITIASISPTKDLPAIDIPWLDKIAHIVLYLLLTVIWLSYAYAQKSNSISLKVMLLVLFGCFVYGIIIEVIQDRMTSFRRADTLDVVANLVGVILGWGMFILTKNRIFPKPGN